MINRFVILLLGLTCLAVTESVAKVTLPQIYTDSMVVQQWSTAGFHGKATPGATVTAVAGWGKESTAIADGEGNWELTIVTPKASLKTYTVSLTDGADNSVVTLSGVMAGEVWLCSGQSNMEMPLAGWGKVMNYEQEIATAAYPYIRLLHIKRHTSMLPCRDTPVEGGGWQVCSPVTVPEFSAVAYFFARELWRELKVPVGVIDCTWGGSPIEAWLSYRTLSEAFGFKGIIDSRQDSIMDDPAIRARYASLLEGHNRGEKPVERVDSASYGHRDGFPGTIDGHTFYPAELHNAMLFPLSHLSIKGVLWYQGENNGDRAGQYDCLFPRLINDWRELFGNPSMPFYYVQLANWRARKDVQPHSDWGYLRESQARALHMPYTGMAVTIDIGEADDIHPKNKQEVARRLSLIALARDYGRKVGYRAPAYRDYSIEGDTCYITFDAPSSAFMKSDVSLDGFIIAGTDGQFYKAEARWAGDRLAVSSPHVRVPVAVRYAWADNPAVSLYGRNMLPVAPFRTDTW